jgi:hypothetical protein
MRPNVQLTVVALGCLAAVPGASDRTQFEPANPSGLKHPRGPCPDPAEWRADDVADQRKPAVPYDRALTKDGCWRERAFRRGDVLRTEDWRFATAADGGLRPVNVQILEVHARWNTLVVGPEADGGFSSMTTTDYDGAGTFVRDVSISRDKVSGLERQTRVAARDGGLHVTREVAADAGWVLVDEFESSATCVHRP